MSEIIFVLGAGASRDCGAPLMCDFLDTASRLLSVSEVDDKKDHFIRVFKAIANLQAVHSKAQLDLNNIESIFTAFEIANVLGKLPGFTSSEIPTVINSLKELIVTTLERTIYFPIQKSQILPTEVYNSFAGLVHYLGYDAYKSFSSSVITFNYDIALDYAMYFNHLNPTYGFESKKSADSSTNLLKLHGSLNWAVMSDTGNVIPLTLPEYFSKYSINSIGYAKSCRIPIGSHLKEFYSKHSSIKVNPEPVIVPPTWNKSEYHKLLAQVWGKAAKELEEASYIFIIGYSLPETDAFFKLLYALGSVGNTPLKKIVVFNPDSSGKVEERFISMLGPGAIARFSYSPLNFINSIIEIRGMFPERKK